MSSENYRIGKQHSVYFITFTVKDLVNVFTRLKFKNIIALEVLWYHMLYSNNVTIDMPNKYMQKSLLAIVLNGVLWLKSSVIEYLDTSTIKETFANVWDLVVWTYFF